MANMSMTSLAPPFDNVSTTIATIVSHAATSGMAASTTGVAAATETTTAMSEQTLMYIVIPASVIVGVPLLITAVVAFVSCVCSICKRQKRRAASSCCCCEAAATNDADEDLDRWPSDGGVKPRKVNSIAPTRPLRDDRRRAEPSVVDKQPRRQQIADRGATVGAAALGTTARRNSLTQGWDF